MEYFAGIDVSMKDSSVCVVDAAGRIARGVKVASELEALIAWFGELGLEVTWIGLAAGPLSQWLHVGLSEAGIEVVLLETLQPVRSPTRASGSFLGDRTRSDVPSLI